MKVGLIGSSSLWILYIDVKEYSCYKFVGYWVTPANLNVFISEMRRMH